jgi:pyridinium-3,5-bisthiocarboxylic acid mononucleotide nickel chelatase
MTVGALLDLGLDFEFLKTELAKLAVTGFELKLSRVDRSGINAAKSDVHLTGQVHHEQKHEEAHSHRHHEHSHDHRHKHKSHHGSQRSHVHRSLSTIRQLIESSPLSDQRNPCGSAYGSITNCVT